MKFMNVNYYECNFEVHFLDFDTCICAKQKLQISYTWIGNEVLRPLMRFHKLELNQF